jgi:toxin ParE1/3/4
MTGRFALTPRARADIDDIWDHTARRWGADQAQSYVRQLAHHMALIANQPGLGNACPEIRAAYHRFPSGAHMLFYRITEDGVEIIRILHARMDVQRHL